jgi:thioredoxin 1
MVEGGKLMKKYQYIQILVFLVALILASNVAISQNKAKITFIELGSTSCIPCKKMQPIMKNIEKKYGEQIKVIFYDIKKEKEKADQYKINLIPTQVFLDENGKEIHRHVGYYPEIEIDKFLKKQGLKAKL